MGDGQTSKLSLAYCSCCISYCFHYFATVKETFISWPSGSLINFCLVLNIRYLLPILERSMLLMVLFCLILKSEYARTTDVQHVLVIAENLNTFGKNCFFASLLMMGGWKPGKDWQKTSISQKTRKRLAKKQIFPKVYKLSASKVYLKSLWVRRVDQYSYLD